MARITVRPTRLDKEIARGIARHADLPIERAAGALTWGADEHVLIAAAAIGWLLTRKSEEPVSRLSTHVLICSLATAILPHVLKDFIELSAPTAAPSWAIGVAFYFPENRRMRFPPVTPCTSALSHPLRRYCRLEHEISSGQSAQFLSLRESSCWPIGSLTYWLALVLASPWSASSDV